MPCRRPTPSSIDRQTALGNEYDDYDEYDDGDDDGDDVDRNGREQSNTVVFTSLSACLSLPLSLSVCLFAALARARRGSRARARARARVSRGCVRMIARIALCARSIPPSAGLVA